MLAEKRKNPLLDLLPQAPDRFITIRQLGEMLGVSRATIHRFVAKGDFPKPLKISAGSVRWSLREIEGWLAARPRGEYVEY